MTETGLRDVRHDRHPQAPRPQYGDTALEEVGPHGSGGGDDGDRVAGEQRCWSAQGRGRKEGAHEVLPAVGGVPGRPVGRGAGAPAVVKIRR
ncbi:hypothetical protein GCM10023235_01460 [Kitasatospora terrestris]|uniref:Uncharacterized protein n=1 Tax=Kitasatospora terrestris TaxID=258051 RepID=A0ABP9DBL1_9ACTN